MNSTHYCVLTCLAEQAGHGYFLALKIEREFGYYIEPMRLYRTLLALEKRGLITSGLDVWSAGPTRRRYELTPHGRRILADETNRLEMAVRLARKVTLGIKPYGRPLSPPS